MVKDIELNTSKKYDSMSNENLLRVIRSRLDTKLKLSIQEYTDILNTLILRNNKDYFLSLNIGSGGYGSIYKVVDIQKDQLYAMKIILSKDLNILEINIAQRYQHPNIIKLHNILYINRHLSFIMDLASSDLMSELLYGSLSPTNKIKYIVEIGDALRFLSENNIIHCDVKAINVVIVNGSAKLTDFGISRFMSKNIKLCESFNYRDLELMKFPGITDGYKYKRGELWSYGILCLEIIFGISSYRSIQFHKKPDAKSIKTLKFIVEFWDDYIKAGSIKNRITYLIKYFGKPASVLKPVLEYLVESLVTEEQHRISSYNKFLDNKLFSSYNINPGSVIEPIHHKVKQKIPLFRSTIKLFVSYMDELKMNYEMKFLGIELFKNTWDRYKVYTDMSTINNHIVTCALMASSIINIFYHFNINDFSDGEHDDVVDYYYNFLIQENGSIYRRNLYEYVKDDPSLAELLLNYLYYDNSYYTKYNLDEFMQIKPYTGWVIKS